MIHGTIDDQLAANLILRIRGGIDRDVEHPFLLDTGFTGLPEVAIREDVLMEVGAVPCLDGTIRQADGKKVPGVYYKLQILWHGRWKDCLAWALPIPQIDDGDSFLKDVAGSTLMRNSIVHIECWPDGGLTILDRTDENLKERAHARS